MEKTIKYLENGEYHYATVKDVGDLAKLKTDSKDDLVTAINELFITGGEASKKPDGYDELVDNVADAIQKQQQMTDTITNMQQSAQLSDAEMQHMKQVQEEAHQDYIKALKEFNDAIAQANADALELDKKTDELKKNADDLNKKTNDLQDKLNETFTNVANEVSAVHKQLDTESAGLHKELNDTKASLEATRKDLLNNTQEFGVVNSEVKELKDKMDRRIWSTDLDPVREQVNKNSTEVAQTKDELKSKADQSNLDLVTNSVENLSTQVKENADGLKVSVKKDELGGDVAKLLNDKTNLLLGTRSFSGEDNWKNRDAVTIEPGYYKGLKSVAVQVTDRSIYQPYHVKANTAYTFSFFGKEDKDNPKATLIVKPIDAPNINIDNAEQPVHITTEWQRFAVTFSADQDCDISIQIIQGPEASNNILHLAGFKLQYGQNNTPWEPNEADVAENIEHNESQFNVYSDQIAGIVKKQEKMGDTERQLDTRITETAEGLKQTSKDLQDANGKITEFKGQLESTARGLKTEYEKYTNDAIGQISDSSLNLIRNSAFQNKDDNFDQWQNVSAKVNIREDENGLRWVELTQSGMTTDNPQGITSNYFVIKQGKVTVAVDIKLGDKANLDNQNILLLELYNDNKQRVDFTDVSVSQLGLSTAILNDHNVHRGLYRLGIDRKDVKYMTVKALLVRNGDLYFTNFSAKLSSIDDGAYIPNPDDVNNQILKMNTKIEEDAQHIALKANSVDVTRDIKSAVDGIQVGGTNLLRGTSSEAISGDAPTTGWKDMGSIYNTSGPLNEKQYVLSFDARGDVDKQIIQTFLWAGYLGGHNIVTSSVTSQGDKYYSEDGNSNFTLTTQWTRYWVIYNVSPDNTRKQVIVGRRQAQASGKTASGKVYIKSVKLEEGNKSTSWSPAPEDVDSKFQYKEVTGAIDFNDLKTQQKIFYRDNQAKNSPAGGSYWYFVDVKPISDRIVQVATSDRNNITWMRTLADTWTPWQRQATQGDVDNVNGQINTANGKISTLQLATQWHTVSGPLDLNNLKTQQRIFYQDTQDKNSAVSGWQYIVVDSSSDKVTQTVWKDNSTIQYIRQFTGAWSNWVRQTNQNDIDEAKTGLREEIKSAKDAAINVTKDNIEIKVNELKTTYEETLNTKINEVKTASEKFTSDGIEQTVRKITDVKGQVDGLDRKVDNIHIGGRNLLRNSSGPFQPQNDGRIDNYQWYTDSTIDMVQGQQYTISGSTNGTFSGDHSVSVESDKCILWLVKSDGSSSYIVSDSNVAKGTTFTWENSSGKYLLRVNTYHPAATNKIKAWNIKIEKGNRATDWTPAPEDINQSIKDATEYKTVTGTIDFNNLKTQQKIFYKDLQATNAPAGGNYWYYLDVEPGYDGRILQTAISDRDNITWVRTFVDNWGPWIRQADQRNVDDLNNQIDSLKTETTASVKNLGDRVTTEVNSITTRQNNFENETKAQHSNDVELVRKSDFEDGSKGGWTVQAVVSATNPAPPAELGQSGMKVLQTNVRDAYEDGIWYSVKPDEKFDVDYWCAPSSSFHTTFGLVFADKDKQVLDWGGINSDQSGQWKHYTGTITAPANAAFAKAWYQMEKPADNTADTSWIAKPHIRRQNPQVAEKISELNTKWDVANGQIQGKVTETQVNDILNGKGYATQSWAQGQFRLKSDSIDLEVKKITDPINAKIDNLQVGGRNLLTNTDKDISVTSHTTDGYPAWANIDTGYSFEHGKTYTFSTEARNSTDKITEASIRVFEYSTNTQVGIYALPADGKRHSVTFTVPNDSHDYHLLLYAGHAGIVPGVTVTTTYHHPKLELGNVATDWTLAPEDVNKKIDTQTLDSANIDQMKTQGHYFVHNLTGNPIGGWVYVDVTGNGNDRIKQDVYQDSGYEHRSRRWYGSYWTEWTTDVNNKNVVSQINITPDQIKIASNKIEIDGNTDIHGVLSVPEVKLQGKSGMIGLDGNKGIIISSTDTLFQTRVTKFGMDFLTTTNGQKEIMGGITTGFSTNNGNLNGISIVLDTQQKLGYPYGGDFFSIGNTTSIVNDDNRSWNRAMDYDASGQLHQGGFMWYEKSYLVGEGQDIYIGGVRGNGNAAHDPIQIGTFKFARSAQPDKFQPTISLGYAGGSSSDSGLGLVWNQMKPYGCWDITDVGDIWYDGQKFRFTWVSHPNMMGNSRQPGFVRLDDKDSIDSGIAFAPGSMWAIGSWPSNITAAIH